jgi:seryl-tRNA synthetase
MLDLRFIRENPEAVRRAIEVKQVDLNLDELLAADEEVRSLKLQIQKLQEEKNANAKKVSRTSAEERPVLIARGAEIGEELKGMEPKLRLAEEKLQDYLWLVPNIPAPDAPLGKDESENVEVKKWGEPRHFDFTPLDHVQILEKHNWAEFERIAKVSGSRSYALKNEMVLLEMALLHFALDILQGKGFNLMSVPSIVREFTLFGTGHFPTGRDQVYYLPADELYLSGTAEVPLNSLHSDEILNEADLPILYAGYSPCFRREAGSGGRDVRGLIRVHQFYKVEQYVLCKNDAEESDRWHKQLLGTAEEILQALELPYHIVECCTGDMGAGKFRMHDIETWVPSEGKYRETHSCSTLHDWQARRTNLRYRGEDGKVRFCHTLNNTAVATPRLLAPFLENHQQIDGSIRIPEKLRPYMGGLEKLG